MARPSPRDKEAGSAGELWQAPRRHYRPLIARINAQTERRILAGEPVPAVEKLVSVFEPRADIIVKGGRDVDYGHELNLTTGRSVKSLIAAPDRRVLIRRLVDAISSVPGTGRVCRQHVP